MKLLVLAAGIGSRFGGVKQLAAVGPGGETLLEYNLYDALRAGFDSIVFLIRKEIEEDFMDVILRRLPKDLPYELAYQSPAEVVPARLQAGIAATGRTKPWGTGHALLCAEEQLAGCAFGVVNADDFYGRFGIEAVARFLSAGENRPGDEKAADRGSVSRFCLAGYRLGGVVPSSGSVSRAICDVRADGLLRGIVEHTKVKRRGDLILSFSPEGAERQLPSDALASMNLWGLDSSVFPKAHALFESFLAAEANWKTGEFFLPAIVGSMVATAEAEVRVLPVEEHYFGLTNPEDLAGVREALARRSAAGDYPSPLWSGGFGRRRQGEREEA